jgi:hypothetical protein
MTMQAANNLRNGDVLEDVGSQPHDFDVADFKASFTNAERRKAVLIGGAAGLALGVVVAYVLAKVVK